MDDDLEELFKKELAEKQAERQKQAEEEQQNRELIKKFNKFMLIIFVVIAVAVAIIIISIYCKPKNYEYKITQYEVMQFDDTKGIVSIKIKNNTNKKNTCYVQIRIFDAEGGFLTYGEAAFTPPPKSTDIYQMTVQSPFGSLRGTTVKITSFNIFNLAYNKIDKISRKMSK